MFYFKTAGQCTYYIVIIYIINIVTLLSISYMLKTKNKCTTQLSLTYVSLVITINCLSIKSNINIYVYP